MKISESHHKISYQKLQNLLRYIVRIFTPLALGALLWAMWNSRVTFQPLIYQSKLIYLISALGLWVIIHFTSPMFTSVTFQACGQVISYRKAFLIHTSRLPAKYLPGGIWHSVARISDYHSQGIFAKQITIYLLIENLIAAAITLLLGGSVVANLSGAPSGWRWAAGCLATLGLTTLLVMPWAVNRFMLSLNGALNQKLYYIAILCSMTTWLVAGSAFALYLSSFPSLQMSTSLFEAAGVYIFAWGVGFIALFAPQGIGVAEFTSAQLLSTLHPIGTLVALMAGFRALILCADLIAWIISLLVNWLIAFRRPFSSIRSAQP